MKKILVLCMVMFFALSSAALASDAGHSVIDEDVEVIVEAITINPEQVTAPLPDALQTAGATNFSGVYNDLSASTLNAKIQSGATGIAFIQDLVRNAQNLPSKLKNADEVIAAVLPPLRVGDTQARTYAVILPGLFRTLGEIAHDNIALLVRVKGASGPAGLESHEKFKIINASGTKADNLKDNETYYLEVEVEENANYILYGSYYLDMTLAAATQPEEDDSRWGCNAGLSLLTGILALSGLLFIKRKK